MKYLGLTVATALVLIAGHAFAGGDAARGGKLYDARCSGCHSIEHNRVGPAHQNTFGRRAGSAPDYDYSPALKRSKLVWNEVNLNRWLASPERAIPGQKMGYLVDDAQDRADLIAYLKVNSAAK